MDLCDFSGGSDFDLFLRKAKTNFDYNDEVSILDKISNLSNESLCLSGDEMTKLKEDGGGDMKGTATKHNDNCFPIDQCCGEGLEVSDEPPTGKLDPLQIDPFGFLKSANKYGRQLAVVVSPKKEETPTLSATREWCKQGEEFPKNIRFFLQFTRTTGAAADRTDHCYAAEKKRCLEFWAFVQKHAELSVAVKDGSFFHKGRLKRVDCRTKSKMSSEDNYTITKSLKSSSTPAVKYSPSMEELRQRNLKVHRDEKRRREKTHSQLKALSKKSGQIYHDKIRAKKAAERAERLAWRKHPCWRGYADCVNPTPDQLFGEMERFDDFCNNPVKATCAFRQRRQMGLVCPPPITLRMLETAGEDYVGIRQEVKGEMEASPEDDEDDMTDSTGSY